MRIGLSWGCACGETRILTEEKSLSAPMPYRKPPIASFPTATHHRRVPGHSCSPSFKKAALPGGHAAFVDTTEKAYEIVARITRPAAADGVARCITRSWTRIAAIVAPRMRVPRLIRDFISQIEKELGLRASHAIGSEPRGATRN